MSYNTPQGRAYTLGDLERLVSINSFGQYNGAIAGLIQSTKHIEKTNENLTLQVESYKNQLLELRAEVNALKK